MAATSNKLTPVLVIAGVALVGFVLFKQFSGGAVKPGADLKTVPSPTIPKTVGADNDNAAETLKTVAASNESLRQQVDKVLEANRKLTEDNRRMQQRLDRAPTATAASAAPAQPKPSEPPAATATATAAQTAESDKSVFGQAIENAAHTADTFTHGFPGAPQSLGGGAAPQAAGASAASYADASASVPGEVSYRIVPPMGWQMATERPRGGNSTGVAMTRYVRTTEPTGAFAPAVNGPASQAARKAATQKQKKDAIPYFTVPENATLAGAIAMTSLIGRVPIDNRVNDPMQFKAVIGRDNLAANGFEMPPDISGMIISGIAIGDMALSCTEGKVHSVTFVFNDGAIRTISHRNRTGAINTQNNSASNDYLGYISDLHGNPCIPGTFVTNAPRYLTDIVGLSTLGVAGQAFADAQRTTYAGADGASSSVTGNVGNYALGQAVAGGTNEVTKWMLQRLKNSFDAVIVPSGKQLVVHIDKELDIDKARDPRRLIHRQQVSWQTSGAHYGLE